MGYRRILTLGTLAGALIASAAAAIADAPYVVRNNLHVIIGVTLDEDAVRAALPKGIEPVADMSGGLNLYNSGGGEGVAAYDRSYVWVNVEEFDSRTGQKGRYILWVSDGTHFEKVANDGYVTEVGSTDLVENGTSMTAVTEVGNSPVIKTVLDLAKSECGPIAGTLNYPIMPKGSDAVALRQYAFSGKGCGASLVSLAIEAPSGHALTALNPQTAGWSVVVRDLSFAASPTLALPKAE